jgi:hypothetical protein
LLFVEAACLVLAIARDEGNRVSFVQQRQRASYFFRRQAKVARNVPQIDRRGWGHASIESADMDLRRAPSYPGIRANLT